MSHHEAARDDWAPLCEALGAEFNPAAVLRLAALDPTAQNGLMPRLFRLYADVMKTQAEVMERCSRQGDLAGLREAAHAVRSSSLSMGAESFSQACQDLERRIHQTLCGPVQDDAALSSAPPPGVDSNALCVQGQELARRAQAIRQSVVSGLAVLGDGAA